MKKIITLLAAVTVFGIAAPSVSQAWDQCNHGYQPRVVSYLPCGRPVLAIYQIYGYDRCGNPLGRWVTQRESCGCSTCNPRPSCPPSYGRYGGYQPSHHDHHSSGTRWSFSFGR
ncbi:MAG: hypothetical protein ABL974_17580 [Prosthecobacter sp.]